MLALGLVAVVASLVLATAALGSAVVARHRAGAAADLAALAAADRQLGRAAGPPCPAARAVASADGAELTSCRPAPDGSVSVTVVVRLPAPVDPLGSGPGRGPRRAAAASVSDRQRQRASSVSCEAAPATGACSRRIARTMSSRNIVVPCSEAAGRQPVIRTRTSWSAAAA